MADMFNIDKLVLGDRIILRCVDTCPKSVVTRTNKMANIVNADSKITKKIIYIIKQGRVSRLMPGGCGWVGGGKMKILSGP